MNCLIITSYVKELDRLSEIIEKIDFDICICADGGYKHAAALEITPDMIIGDFDSSEVPTEAAAKNIIVLPKEKDVTDGDAAIAKAIELGADRIRVLSTMGGRADHTLGIFAIVAKYTSNTCKITVFDSQNKFFLLRSSSAEVFSDGYKYMSLVSYSEKCLGVTETGVKYPLKNAVLTNETTLGISNEITGPCAHVTVKDGDLLVMLSKDL